MTSSNPTSMSGGKGGSGGGGSSNSSGGSSSCGGPCGACKFLRRKCVVGCIFAPYFDSEQGASHFAAVHKVFGASNVSKMLLHIPVHKRLDAVVTICFEAQARLRDPVYGCVAHIFALQQQVVNLQGELNYLQAHLANLELPTPPPPPPAQQPLVLAPPLSISDLPTTTSPLPAATYDLSSLFDPLGQQQASSWAAAMHPWQMDLRHFGGATSGPPETPSSSSLGGGNGDLQELARALLQQHDGTVTVASTPLLPHSQ